MFGEKKLQLCEVSSSPPGSPVRPGATQHLLPEGEPQALAQDSMPFWLRGRRYTCDLQTAHIVCTPSD